MKRYFMDNPAAKISKRDLLLDIQMSCQHKFYKKYSVKTGDWSPSNWIMSFKHRGDIRNCVKEIFNNENI